ncbi:MAG TPA: AI-2E family transporter [Methylomirabilota bacterium]|nr:AI-2E family transporter [Methylomirabilota bacterium]
MGEESTNRPEAAPTPEEPPRLQRLSRPRDVTAVCLLLLLVLAGFYTLYFAREFLLPIALGWMISLVLKPCVRALEAIDIPTPVGALITLLAALGILVSTFYFLTEPATKWVRQAPENMQRIEEKVRALAKPAEKVRRAAEEVEKLTEMGEQPTTKVQVKDSSLVNSMVVHTKGAFIMALETFVFVYFLLAAGDVFLLKLIQALPKLRDKKRAVEIAKETQQQISGYLFALTLLNIFEGTAVGIGMWLIGMPNPLLWGVMAALVNYIPYIGAMVGIAVVTMVGFVTFDTVGQSLAPAAVYLSINFIDNFIAPYFMGKRLTLNPVMVFLSLMFWGWLWGIVGVLLAVPLLMTIKVFCDHIPPIAAIGEFLAGQREPDAPQKPTGAPLIASA